MIIIDHNHPWVVATRNQKSFAAHKYNGAYYYSLEIAEFFIPTITTDRNWVTMNVPNEAPAHSIVFAHNNVHLEWYEKYLGKDPVFVCGMPETAEKLRAYGSAIYLPLSIDTAYVSQFRTKQTKDVCYVGRREKRTSDVPEDIDCLEKMPRPELLSKLARYKRAYAVDRCAVEARCLGVEVLPYGYHYGVEHDPEFWQVVDSRDAARMLQEKLKFIDGK